MVTQCLASHMAQTINKNSVSLWDQRSFLTICAQTHMHALHTCFVIITARNLLATCLSSFVHLVIRRNHFLLNAYLKKPQQYISKKCIPPVSLESDVLLSN